MFQINKKNKKINKKNKPAIELWPGWWAFKLKRDHLFYLPNT
jgi:hypothetical protein